MLFPIQKTTPTTLSPCLAWYDVNDPAGDGSQPADTSKLGTFEDKSGFQRPLLQVTGGNQPEYQYNIFGNKPGLYFDGVNSYMRITTQYTLPNDSTIIVAFKTTDLASANIILASKTNLGGRFQLTRYNPDPMTNALQVWNGSLYAVSITPDTNPHISILRQSGITSVDFILDGVQFGGGSINNVNLEFGQLAALGGDGPDGGGTPSVSFAGYIAEIIIYGRRLTDAESLQINQYLSNKWGIPV